MRVSDSAVENTLASSSKFEKEGNVRFLFQKEAPMNRTKLQCTEPCNFSIHLMLANETRELVTRTRESGSFETLPFVYAFAVFVENHHGST